MVSVFPDRSFETDLDVIYAFKTYFLIIHILFHFFFFSKQGGALLG